jgi:hypothetical protein
LSRVNCVKGRRIGAGCAVSVGVRGQATVHRKRMARPNQHCDVVPAIPQRRLVADVRIGRAGRADGLAGEPERDREASRLKGVIFIYI